MKNNLFMIVVITIFNNSLGLLNFISKYYSRLIMSSAIYALLGFIGLVALLHHIIDNSFIISDTSISQLSILPIFNLKQVFGSLFKLLTSLFKKLTILSAKVERWFNSNDNNFKLLGETDSGYNYKKLTIKVVEPYQDMKVLLSNLFNYLNGLEVYSSINNKKVLITASDNDGINLTLNKAVLISDTITFEEIYNKFLPTLDKIRESFYNIEPEAIVLLEVVIINLDVDNNNKNNKNNKNNPLLKRGFHTSITSCRDSIVPLTRKTLNGKPFASLDIETMEIDGNQQPVLISLTYSSKGEGLNTQTFLLNPSLSIDIGILNLWREFFNFIENDLPKYIKTIFVHNLGGFDGIFIYKYLGVNYKLDEVNTIIDPDNKFIQITLKLNNRSITWLDSYRIFPVSLNQLCEVFKFQGKLSDYNSLYQDLSLFY